MKSKIIAHRGVRTKYPENTVLAIEKALAVNISGVEFDLELTSDSKLVLLHQETLIPKIGKLALAKRDAKRAWVNRLDSTEVCKLDAGSWFNRQFSNLRIPFFSDVLKLDWGNKTALIELKDPYHWTEPDVEFENSMVKVAEQALRSLNPKSFIVLSFNEVILQKLRILNPKLKLGLNLWHNRLDQINDFIEFAQKLDISLLQFPDQVLCERPEIISSIHAVGIAVGSYSVSPAYDDPNHQDWTFTSYQPTLKRLVELSVDYIITDFPVESLEYLDDDLRHN